MTRYCSTCKMNKNFGEFERFKKKAYKTCNKCFIKEK